MATLFIEISALFGLAYDLKRPSKEMVLQHAEKKGDVMEVKLIHKKNLFIRLLIGLFDWIMGSIVTSWPIWTIMFIKMALGMKFFHFDWNDFIFLKL